MTAVDVSGRPRRLAVDRWLAPAAVVLAVVTLALLLLQVTPLFSVTERLDPVRINVLSGNSYTYALEAPLPLVRNDNIATPQASDLVLFEDGAAIGMPHSRHDMIASEGRGRYSHWTSAIYFSTSDNTDPRTNGRAYSVEYRYSPPAWLLVCAFTALVIAIARIGLLRSAPARRSRTGDLGPLLVLAIVAAVAMGHLLGSSAQPVILMNNDGGNISDWIVGRMYPERFVTDFLLSDSANTDFYISLFRPLVQLFSWVTGDIGLAYLWTYLPIQLVQLAGFYFLGKLATNGRLWAVVLALLTAVPIFIWGQNELFGTFLLPLARTAYDAILPWLLLLFLTYGARTLPFLLLCAACSASFYLHPVSAPGGTAGLLLASLALRNSSEPFWRRLAISAAGGVLFVILILPYAIPFLGTFSGGESIVATGADPAVYASALEAFETANGPYYYDAWLAVTTFLGGTGLFAWPVFLPGLAGLLIVPVFVPEHRRLCAFLLLFLLGCLIASVGICLVDQAIARSLGRTPFQLDLIRGMRLIIPPLLIGFVIVLAELHKWVRGQTFSRPFAGAAAGVAVLVVASWWTMFPNRVADQLGLADVQQDYTRQDLGATAILARMKGRDPDGTVLPIGPSTVGLAVRYAALQPVAFIANDLNALFYSGSEKRFLWTELNLISQAMRDPDPAVAVSAFDDLVRRSGARYVLIQDFFMPAPVQERAMAAGRIVEREGTWSLIDLRP